MNRRGQFGFLIGLVVLFLLLYIWVIILPAAIKPSMTIAIDATSASPNGDGVAFFVSMIPWAVPAILIIGFLFYALAGGSSR